MICLSFCLLYSISSFFVQMSFFQLYNLYALAPMFITSVSLFSIWQTVDTLDFCWLALFLALSAKTCFYEQNSHPEKTIPAITPPCNLDSFAEKCFHLRKTTWSWGNCTKSSLVFWDTKRKIGAIACSGDVWGVLACKSHRFAEMSKELKEEAIIQWNCRHFSALVHIYDDNDSNSVGINIDNYDDDYNGNNSVLLSAFSTMDPLFQHNHWKGQSLTTNNAFVISGSRFKMITVVLFEATWVLLQQISIDFENAVLWVINEQSHKKQKLSG